MLEIKGDILKQTDADAICFTSNGIIKGNGALVMGAGVARVFRDNFKQLDFLAGSCVQDNGNICQIIKKDPTIISFPTKNHWKNPSNIKLIITSAQQLMVLVESNNWKKVYLPRPGCKNGGLEWAMVRAALAPILDDRVIIITF